MRRAVKYSPRLTSSSVVSHRTSALGKGGKLFADGIGEPQLIGDIEIALPDVGEQVLHRTRGSSRAHQRGYSRSVTFVSAL